MVGHFDVDAFYANVEIRDNPQLKGKPVAVAGSSRRAVVLTASYEARPFGVKSAVPLYKALAACPQLVVVPPRMQTYREVSSTIFAIFERRRHRVEGLSMDEAFIDFGDVAVDDAVALANTIRAEVYDEVGLSVSAGVASGKMLAKILSDACKPNGLQAVRPGEEAAFLQPLPVGRLWGVGPKTEARLLALGISTIGQVAALDDVRAQELFGSWGPQVVELARGVDHRAVEADRETKSISTEETFEYDVRDTHRLRELLKEQARELAAKLQRDGLSACTIGVKIRRADFQTVVRQTNLSEPTADARAIFVAAVHCLRRAQVENVPVRLLGTRVACLIGQGPKQQALFTR